MTMHTGQQSSGAQRPNDAPQPVADPQAAAAPQPVAAPQKGVARGADQQNGIEQGNTAPRFAGKTALITGASRGIGLAIAQRLVAEGARVCITARKEDALRDAVALIAAGRGSRGSSGSSGQTAKVASKAIYSVGKADDPAHRTATLDQIEAEFGGLDILVNNAGINPFYGRTIDIDIDAARKLLEVNLLSTLGWSQAVYHHEGLGFASRGAGDSGTVGSVTETGGAGNTGIADNTRRGGPGSIVNVASVAGRQPAPGIGFYGITKAAVMHLTSTLAAELGPGVRVNAVAPAVVKTEFARALYEGREAEVAAAYPAGRLGEPEDIAAAVAYLASDDAAWITGQTLTLDGGLLSAGGTL